MIFRNLLLSTLIVFATQSFSQQTKGIFVDFNKTEKVKKLIAQKNADYLPAYEALMEKANRALNEGPFSVMDKKRTPPSGDKHDYLSGGPYWWPDPTKPDGLPYIRKDGKVNPEMRGENVDPPAAGNMKTNVENLAWAYYFSGEKKYADKAIELLQVWFLNPETKMNPNLNFAQGIPGIMDGRGIGIIDWAGIDAIISPIQIFDAYGLLDAKTKQGLLSWFDEYLTWLLTSKYGIDEDTYFNNHGTWYDVQAVAIQQLLGKTEDAKQRLEVKTKARIASQIEPDGSQPHELARTKSLSYSTMNLRGFTQLANMSENVGVDLWNFETPDGREIQKSYEFLLPFVLGEKEWKHEQITQIDEVLESLKFNFLVAAQKTKNQTYTRVANTIEKPCAELEILLYPLLK